ncbi:MAG: carboxypeptidase-like regulatory domain-containing protein [Bacteroidaceae bacterium]|nr:carboxypeptidase-like regulatory domain-containing protein [Bacteroidaceae bacterium]
MKRQILLFMLMMVFAIPSIAQMITGKVFDALDNEPLEGVQVWYKDRPTGKVLTDANGNYKIRFRPGTLVFYYFGYKNVEVVVKKARTLNVTLSMNAKDIETVTVKAEKKKYVRKGNPAVEMMQKVIAARKSADIHDAEYASYDRYISTTMALNDVDTTTLDEENFKKVNLNVEFAEYCPATGKMILPISFEERITKEYFRKDGDRRKSIVLGEHKESLLDLLQATEFVESKIKTNLVDVDIYKDQTVIFQHNFISPIGGAAAIRFYHYAIKDTVECDGDSCFVINFQPANKQDFGWNGDLYIIADSTWRVKRARMGMPMDNSVNFVKHLTLDQEFESLPSGQQFCTSNRMIMQAMLTEKIKKLHIEHYARYTNISNEPFPDELVNFLGDEKVEKGAKHRSEDFWAEYRPDTLTHGQMHINDLKRKFTDRPAVRAVLYVMKIFLDNYLETSADPNRPSKIDIGPFFSTFGSNWAEGFRLRLGAQTTGALNKHWFFSGWGKYGFKDKKFKGEGKIAYSFVEKEKDIIAYPRRDLTFSYTRDIQSPSDKFLQYDKDNTFMSIAWQKTHLQSYFERFRFAALFEYENGLALNGHFNREWNRGAGDLYFLTNKQWNNDIGAISLEDVPNVQSNTIVYTEFSFGVSYQPGLKVLNTRTKRYLSNLEAPKYGIQHTVGIKGFLGGDYNYNLTEFTFSKRFWLNSWGSVDGSVHASFQWNKVPFPLLVIPEANLSFIRSRNTFNLVGNMEFLHDRAVTTMWRWDLNGKIFNRIPFLKKLKWRESLALNCMWGYLSSKNNAMLPENIDDDLLYRFPGKWRAWNGLYRYEPNTGPMNSWKPYIEAAVGIHNIFKFLSFEYTHRFTYIGPNTQKWGFRFYFEASF